jgi:ribonuclease HII
MKLDKTLEYGPEHLIKFEYLCGIDEVGRGCGAGPVVTAAVILPKGFSSPLLRDSKNCPKTKN